MTLCKSVFQSALTIITCQLKHIHRMLQPHTNMIFCWKRAKMYHAHCVICFIYYYFGLYLIWKTVLGQNKNRSQNKQVYKSWQKNPIILRARSILVRWTSFQNFSVSRWIIKSKTNYYICIIFRTILIINNNDWNMFIVT